jgi:hypothetical protein
MASEIYSGIGDALTDAFTVLSTSFVWQGNSYGCALNVESATLVTSKSLFSGTLPKAGDTITVQGKDRQVLGLANASTVLVPGGYVEPGTPYVDDPSSPAFSIHYGAFIRG